MTSTNNNSIITLQGPETGNCIVTVTGPNMNDVLATVDNITFGPCFQIAGIDAATKVAAETAIVDNMANQVASEIEEEIVKEVVETAAAPVKKPRKKRRSRAEMAVAKAAEAQIDIEEVIEAKTQVPDHMTEEADEAVEEVEAAAEETLEEVEEVVAPTGDDNVTGVELFGVIATDFNGVRKRRELVTKLLDKGVPDLDAVVNVCEYFKEQGVTVLQNFDNMKDALQSAYNIVVARSAV